MNPACFPDDGWMSPERASARESHLARVAAGAMHDLNNRLGTALLAASSLEGRRAALESALANGTLRRVDLATFLTRHQEAQGLVAESLGLAAAQGNALRELALDQLSGRPRVFELRQYLTDALHGLVLTRKPEATLLRVEGDEVTFEHRPALWAAAAEEAATAILPPRGGSATVSLRYDAEGVVMDFTPNPPRSGEDFAPPAQNPLASLRAFVTHCLQGSVEQMPFGLRLTAPAPLAFAAPAA